MRLFVKMNSFKSLQKAVQFSNFFPEEIRRNWQDIIGFEARV